MPKVKPGTILAIMVTVEAPYGSVWYQELSVKNGDVEKAIKNYKKVLGRGYRICEWYPTKKEPTFEQLSIFDFDDD